MQTKEENQFNNRIKRKKTWFSTVVFIFITWECKEKIPQSVVLYSAFPSTNENDHNFHYFHVNDKIQKKS